MNKNIIIQLVIGLLAMILHYSVMIVMSLSTDWIWTFYLFFISVSLYITYFCSREYKNNPDRLGLVFMSLVVAKMLLFGVAFSPMLFWDFEITTALKINMLIPFIIFLSLEVYTVITLLNKSTQP